MTINVNIWYMNINNFVLILLKKIKYQFPIKFYILKLLNNNYVCTQKIIIK